MDLVTKITDNKHFDQNLETRVVSEASTFGLGAALRTLDFIFICIKVLNNYEKNYSRNTLEWLRVVWAAEYFNFFIYMSCNLRSSLITKHSWERWVHQRKPKCIRKLPKNGTQTGEETQSETELPAIKDGEIQTGPIIDLMPIEPAIYVSRRDPQLAEANNWL